VGANVTSEAPMAVTLETLGVREEGAVLFVEIAAPR
jgi:hypothetical protein